MISETKSSAATDTATLMSQKINANIQCAQELATAIAEIKNAFPYRFSDDASTWDIEFISEPGLTPGYKLDVDEAEQSLIVRYSQRSGALRGLGVLMGQLESGATPSTLAQCSTLITIGAMLDVSRNGVLRMDAVRKIIRHFSLMGINQVMLYMEDTYEIPDEPAFGYFRAGYSQEDLRSIDDYAHHFGIEMVPCIQALAHLEQILQWPCYQHLKDTSTVLLTGESATDAFVEKMILAATAPFRSKRIHIGMDEAHGIGSGIYRQKNGSRPPFEILCEHLKRTAATCERHELSPMIWSDMFFRLGSKTNNYYDTESEIAPEVAAQIPENVQLVYWDYYHTDTEFYDDWIQRHKQMGKKPLFAGGIWSWNNFWTLLPHSRLTLEAGMAAVRRKRLDEAFVTMWGDDGMECDIFSVLPAVQLFCDLAYQQDKDSASSSHASNFTGSVDGTFESWFSGDLARTTSDDDRHYDGNLSKWLLWHDPLLSHFERQILPEYAEHFAQMARQLDEIPANRPEDYRLDFVRQLAQTLTLKAELHIQLRPAYRSRDLTTLQSIHDEKIEQLRTHVCLLRDTHEARWHENNRCAGWEVIERRYAGLLSRLDTLQRKLGHHLTDPNEDVEELNYEPQLMWPHEQTSTLPISHRQTAGPSFIG